METHTKINEKIFNKIVEILVDKQDITKERIKPESDLIDDIGLDSLDIVELTVNAEKAFNVSIMDEEIDNVMTVQDLVNIIENKID